MGENMKISCGVYLFNNDNKLLVEHPTGHKPNIWTIPKGRMDDGETDYFEVAKRELFEETNIDLNKLNIIRKEEFGLIRYRETNKYLKGFFVRVDSDLSDIELGCESMVYRNGVPSFAEVDGYKWVTIGEARTILNEFQMANLDRCQELISTNERVMCFRDFVSLL
jgi:8-oxo-dGTP pyrophosphatase MutT (NUDIX family)